jgi:hypothetical protein
MKNAPSNAASSSKPDTGGVSVLPPGSAPANAGVAERRGQSIAEFDYNAAAELFPTRRRIPRRQPLGYKRFAQAAHAVRFAIEDLPPELLIGAFLEVDEHRYSSDDIRRLYESAEYPLPRRGARS